jgi:hypothetical protein
MLNLGETVEEEIFRRKAREIHKKKIREIQLRGKKSFSFTATNIEFQKKRRKFMIKEKVNGINKNNRILLQRLIEISNRRKNKERNIISRRTSRITTLFGIANAKRHYEVSPETTPERHFSRGLRSNKENGEIVEEGQIQSKEFLSNHNTWSLGMANHGKIHTYNDELKFRQSKPAIRYLRDQVINSKFTKRYSEIKRIEQENLKLAQRLYRNKPWISSRRLEDSFKDHLAHKVRMSKYSKGGLRKSVVVSNASRKIGTGYQVKRDSRSESRCKTAVRVDGNNSVEYMLGETQPIEPVHNPIVEDERNPIVEDEHNPVLEDEHEPK